MLKLAQVIGIMLIRMWLKFEHPKTNRSTLTCLQTWLITGLVPCYLKSNSHNVQSQCVLSKHRDVRGADHQEWSIENIGSGSIKKWPFFRVGVGIRGLQAHAEQRGFGGPPRGWQHCHGGRRADAGGAQLFGVVVFPPWLCPVAVETGIFSDPRNREMSQKYQKRCFLCRSIHILQISAILRSRKNAKFRDFRP
jgi:hypothetical protein